MDERVGNLVLGLDGKISASEPYFDDPHEYAELVERINSLRYDFFTLYRKDMEDYTNILDAISEMNETVDSKMVNVMRTSAPVERARDPVELPPLKKLRALEKRINHEPAHPAPQMREPGSNVLYTIAKNYGKEIFAPFEKKFVARNFPEYSGQHYYSNVLFDWHREYKGEWVVDYLEGDGPERTATYPALFVDLTAGSNERSQELDAMCTPLTPDGMVKTYSSRWQEVLDRFTKKEGQADVSIFHLCLVTKPDTSHANTLILDRTRRLLIRFEPHGGESPCYDFSKVDDALNVVVSSLLPIGYRYREPRVYQSLEGPQKRERGRSNWSTVVDKDGRRKEALGFCLAYALLFGKAYAVAGHEFGHKAIADFLTLPSPNEIANYIRNFMTWLVIQSKKRPVFRSYISQSKSA